MFEKSVTITVERGVEIPDKAYLIADAMDEGTAVSFMDDRTGELFIVEAAAGVKWRVQKEIESLATLAADAFQRGMRSRESEEADVK